MGAFEQLFCPGRGDLNKNFPKIQMPGGLPGGMLKLRFDWYINKLCAIDSTISSGLINKVDSIYIFVPWFRFTLMDRALRVLVHRFRTVFDRI